MQEQLTNFARTTLVGSVSEVSTSITVADGSQFPAANFYVVLDATNSAHEIVWVPSRTNNVLNVGTVDNRGRKGTQAVEHRNGAVVVHTILAHHLEEAIKRTEVFLPSRPQGTLVNAYYFDSTVEGFTGVNGPTISVNSGRLSVASAATGSNKYAVSAGTTIDHGEFEFDLVSISSTDYWGMVFRWVDSSNYYLLERSDATDTITLTRYVTGSGTAIKSISNHDLPIAGSSKSHCLLRFVGGEIRLFVDDIQMFAATDTSPVTTAGQIGFDSYGGTVLYDNVKTYSLPSTWTPSWEGGKVNQSSGSDVSKWDVDALPAVQHAESEEFSSGVWDNTGWAWVNGGSSVASIVAGRLFLTSPQTTASTVKAYLKTASLPSDWTITAKMAPGRDTTASVSTLYGILIKNSSTGRLMQWGPGHNATINQTTPRGNKWTTETSTSAGFYNAGAATDVNYYRIRKLSTNIHFEYSVDGVAWQLAFTEAYATFIVNVDTIGFGIFGNVTGIYTLSVDFLRVTASGAFDQPPVGRYIYLDREHTYSADLVTVDTSEFEAIGGLDLQTVLSNVDQQLHTPVTGPSFVRNLSTTGAMFVGNANGTSGTEYIYPGCDIQVPCEAGDSITLSWSVTHSMIWGGQAKAAAFRLRRGAPNTGTLLASGSDGSYSLDSSAGTEKSWIGSYTDVPQAGDITDGHVRYTLTLAGNGGTLWSANRVFYAYTPHGTTMHGNIPWVPVVKTADYTLVSDDPGRIIEMDKATAAVITVDTNVNAPMADNSVVMLYNKGAGTLTVTPAGGVTIRNNTTLAQYETRWLRLRAVDEWVMYG